MLRLNEVKLPINHSKEALYNKIKKILNTKEAFEYEIIRRSLDARKKPDLFFSYIVDVKIKNEDKIIKYSKKNISKVNENKYSFPYNCENINENDRPVIIGLGPAGLFAGLYLARSGFKPIILERGSCIRERVGIVKEFWDTGKLIKNTNVQFGEGGAGAFSDGKLNTLVKDKYGRNKAVLKDLVQNGAPDEIIYDHKPHIGTDKLVDVVASISNEIRAYGGEIFYDSLVDEFSVENNKLISIGINNKEKIFSGHPVVLAIGHSARDTFELLYNQGIYMEPKSFAIGFRVEHDAKLINLNQYGNEHVDILGNANYKVTHQCEDGRGVYSFCMCPGGYVVNASSEENMLAVNGMSYYDRDAHNSNSAIIISINPSDYMIDDYPLNGMLYQRKLEKLSYKIGDGSIPVESYGEYKNKKLEDNIKLNPCIKGKWKHAKVHEILDDDLSKDFIEGIESFSRMIKGFNNDDMIISGIESRTSSPVRIKRDESFLSNIDNLYPCGEGAGYAGGITSAAMDGIAVAEKVAFAILNKKYE